MSNGVLPSRPYVMQSGAEVKIGIAVNPVRRLRAVASGRPEPVSLAWHADFMPGSDARAVEATAQNLLADRHTGGEWFTASIAEAIAAVERATQMIAAGDRSLVRSLRKRVTGEILFARVGRGTIARIKAARGPERESDFLRRLVLETLDRAEAASRKPTSQPKPRSAAATRRQRRT